LYWFYRLFLCPWSFLRQKKKIANSTWTCQNQIAENATCGANDICAGGNVCGAGGICIAPFQGGNGTNCKTSFECSTSLFCNSLNAKCQTPNTFTKVTCEGSLNSTDCNNSTQECRCDSFTGEQICVPKGTGGTFFIPTTYCGEDNSDLLSCLSSNNCSYYYGTFYGMGSPSLPVLGSNSCASENCKSDFKKASGCGCDSYQDVYGKCYASSFCGGFPLWAIIVIAIVVVILVLVVIVVIVMVMRKRRTTYDTIA